MARTMLEPLLRIPEAACEVKLVPLPCDNLSRWSDQLGGRSKSDEVVLRPKSGLAFISELGFYT